MSNTTRPARKSSTTTATPATTPAKETPMSKPATPASKPAPAKTAKPAPRKPANCACGCGAPTITAKALFVSGHDARLAGVLGRSMSAGKPTASEKKQFDALSDALKKKALGVKATADRKAAAKAAREAAKKAAKAAFDKAMAAA